MMKRPTRKLWLVLLILLLVSGLGLAIRSSPTIWTDKADYAPGETVYISGSGFVPGSSLTIKVTRPDGSVVTGDGSFAPWPTAYDTVVADAEGGFQYDYILDGIEGEYLVEAIAEGEVLAACTFTDSPYYVVAYDATLSASADSVQLHGHYEYPWGARTLYFYVSSSTSASCPPSGGFKTTPPSGWIYVGHDTSYKYKEAYVNYSPSPRPSAGKYGILVRRYGTSGRVYEDCAILTVVSPCTPPTVEAGDNQAVCVDAAAFSLPDSQNESPTGGTWSGPGVSGSTFTPSTAGVGSHTITYSYTDPVTGCSNSDTFTMTVNALPTCPITAADVCENSTGNTASTTAGYSGYAWSLTAGTITAGAGTNSITWTAPASSSSPVRACAPEAEPLLTPFSANVSGTNPSLTRYSRGER